MNRFPKHRSRQSMMTKSHFDRYCSSKKMDDRKRWHPSFFSWRNSAILCVGENNQKGAFSMYEDFNIFLLKLPEECKEIMTESCVQFHLPRKHHVCPDCGSQHTYTHDYRKQNLCGIPSETNYIYNRRRYRCQDCGKNSPRTIRS